jgi:hypothetical protein
MTVNPTQIKNHKKFTSEFSQFILSRMREFYFQQNLIKGQTFKDVRSLCQKLYLVNVSIFIERVRI